MIKVGDYYWMDFYAGRPECTSPELIRITSYAKQYFFYKYVKGDGDGRFHENSYMATNKGSLVEAREQKILRLLKAIDE